VEGEFYWIEAFVYSYTGGGFALSVETPPPTDNSEWSNAVPEIQEYTIIPTRDY